MDALELYIYLKEVRGNPTTQQLYRDLLLGDLATKSAVELTPEELEYVNRENALLHDIVIPKIQAALFEYEKESSSTEEEVELARNFPVERHIGEDQERLIAIPDGGRDRSYHLDHYIFDSCES